MDESDSMDSIEARFAALFNSYWGSHEIVELKYGLRWMFNMVKEAAGIHMSTFKDSDNVKPGGIKRDGNEMLSNMKVPPDLMAKWAN